MNRGLVTEQQRFLTLTKLNEIKKWVESVNKFNKKSIYNLTWGGFYKKLCQLGTKGFLQQYGFSSKKKLQLFIARSNLWQEKITLADFEKSTKFELVRRLRNYFLSKVMRQPNFNPKKHKLSTIHYYLHYYSLNFTALSLGFSTKQSFLNFFARTLPMTESVANMAQSLSRALQTLSEIDPVTLRSELPTLYDKPLTQNIRFLRYNATLEELKQALKNEVLEMLIASLGGCSSYVMDKKLRNFLKISLHDLRQKSWMELEQNTPRLSFFREEKLYRIFSGQPLEQSSFILHMSKPPRFGAQFHCQFFSSKSTQTLNEFTFDECNKSSI